MKKRIVAIVLIVGTIAKADSGITINPGTLRCVQITSEGVDIARQIIAEGTFDCSVGYYLAASSPKVKFTTLNRPVLPTSWGFSRDRYRQSGSWSPTAGNLLYNYQPGNPRNAWSVPFAGVDYDIEIEAECGQRMGSNQAGPPHVIKYTVRSTVTCP